MHKTSGTSWAGNKTKPIFVNEECHCSFDEIVVLDSGYRVFSDSKKHDCFESYNFSDERVKAKH